MPQSGLRVEVQGADLLIRWSDSTSADPCIVYRLYVATDVFPKDSVEAFEFLAITGEPVFRHLGAAADAASYDYLVTGFSFSQGEGPLGHYGQ